MVFAFCLRAADRQKLETLERRAIRTCVGAESLAPCDKFYTELKILPLKVRWIVRAICCTFEAVNGMRPTAVSSMFDRERGSNDIEQASEKTGKERESTFRIEASSGEEE